MVGVGIDNALRDTRELIKKHSKGYEEGVERIHQNVMDHRSLLSSESEFFPEVRNILMEYDLLFAKYNAGLV